MLSIFAFPKLNSRSPNQLLRWALAAILCSLAAGAAFAGTFGTVVPIGGQASDIALDEGRGVVYVANYTASRIDVVSTQTQKIVKSINVAAYPASISLSPDGHYLVATHSANFQAPLTPASFVTILDLNANTRQTLTMPTIPVGVAFGADGKALVVTASDFLLLDPAAGSTTSVASIGDVLKTLNLPAPLPPVHPREIIRASLGTSQDLRTIWGTAEIGDNDSSFLLFRYDAVHKQLFPAVWTSTPNMGPRVVSVSGDGMTALTGWAMYHANGYVLSSFPNATGKFDFGSHVFDPGRKLVYAQVADQSSTTGLDSVLKSTLQVLDDDNLTIRETLKLQENLSGRSILDSHGNVMYAVSESGLTILPVGPLNSAPRVAALQEDVVFKGSWCDRRGLTQQIDIVDPGGNHTDFVLVSDNPAVIVSPSSGTTPAKVTVTVDTNAFQSNQGTVTAHIGVASAAGVNVPDPIRVLVNNREPDQRGTLMNVPGRLVDVAADPKRNRFYVLRQDKNQVLAFDAANFKHVGTMRTGNVPWSMTITPDQKYLITTADAAQVAHVFDLDSMQPAGVIVFPFGHWPRWIAASGKAILAASRVSGPEHTIDQIDMVQRVATTLPSLGVWENSINIDTALSATPSGSSILVAMADGTVMLYDANAGTFVAARQDLQGLSGAIAALAENTFIVDNMVLNASLVPVQTLEKASGGSSGFAMIGGLGLRTTAPNSAQPGVIQRIDFAQQMAISPTRMTEAPLLPQTITSEAPSTCQEVQGVLVCTKPSTSTVTLGSAFTRTLAPLPNRSAIVSLSTSGVTVLPWDFGAAVKDPNIQSLVSAADYTPNVAPGGLFTIFGTDLNPVTIATSELPLPTALGDSCLTINGALVPMIYVSPSQINGQVPFEVSGAATAILRTPGGVSNSYKFTLSSTAPAVFQATVEGWDAQIATVVRAENNELVTPSNPIHVDDWITIYATGLGGVAPEVKSGSPAPTSPLANATSRPTVTLGGVDMPISYAGMAPGQVGVYQINIHVPFKGVPTGMSIPLIISQGSTKTTVTVRVVH